MSKTFDQWFRSSAYTGSPDIARDIWDAALASQDTKDPEAVERLIKAARATLGHGSWDPTFNELLAALKEIER